jgi:hypothetical protein
MKPDTVTASQKICVEVRISVLANQRMADAGCGMTAHAFLADAKISRLSQS